MNAGAAARVAVPLRWRVFLTNAAVLAVATLLLLVTPATVSFPVALTELVVLLAGFGAMLGLNFVLLRRVFAPLDRLGGLMRGVDPLQPGVRMRVQDADPPEVAELARAFNEMLARLEQERRQSGHAALAGQERERLRLARELHDEVGQTLTAAMLQLEHGRRVAAGQPAERYVEEAREAVRESMEEVRAIAKRLRPEVLDDLGLRAALAALCNEIARRARVRVERAIDPTLPPLSSEAELVVYRVAQEALTNVARHAGRARARVTLRVEDGAVVLTVADDGVGFAAAARGDGAGLRGMRERALHVGGRLDVASHKGAGTTVRLSLPTPDDTP